MSPITGQEAIVIECNGHNSEHNHDRDLHHDHHGHSHDHHHHGHSHDHRRHVSANESWKHLLREIRKVLVSPGAYRITGLIFLNFFVIILMSYFNNVTDSLTLTAYSQLLWFHFVSLITCYVTYWVKNFSSSGESSRLEVLCVFASTILATLGAMFMFKEGLERIIDPQTVHTGRLMMGGTVAFCSMIFLTFLTSNSALDHAISISSSSWLQEHAADISHSICSWIPILSPILLPRLNPMALLAFAGFGSVFLTDLIIEINNAYSSDNLFSMVIAFMTIGTMFPICLYTGKILLQTTPTHIIPQLDRYLREALTIDGVLEFKNEHFWTVSFGKLAGSLTVRIRKDADDQLVLAHITDRLGNLVSPLTIQVTKDTHHSKASALRQTTIELLGGSYGKTPSPLLLRTNLGLNLGLNQGLSPGLSPVLNADPAAAASRVPTLPQTVYTPPSIAADDSVRLSTKFVSSTPKNFAANYEASLQSNSRYNNVNHRKE